MAVWRERSCGVVGEAFLGPHGWTGASQCQNHQTATQQSVCHASGKSQALTRPAWLCHHLSMFLPLSPKDVDFNNP